MCNPMAMSAILERLKKETLEKQLAAANAPAPSAGGGMSSRREAGEHEDHDSRGFNSRDNNRNDFDHDSRRGHHDRRRPQQHNDDYDRRRGGGGWESR